MKEHSILLNAREHQRFCQAMNDKLTAKGISKKELANEIGVAVKSINNFESDTTKNPSKFLAAKIANYLNIERKEYRGGGAFFIIPLALLIPTLLLTIKGLSVEQVDVIRPVTYPIANRVDVAEIEEQVLGVEYETDFVPGYYEVEEEQPQLINDVDIPLTEEEQATIQEICSAKDLSYELILALIEVESGYSATAISGDGNCLGACQINPKYHDITNPFDLIENVDVATDYLVELAKENEDVNWCLDKYNGNSYADSNFEKGVTSKYAGKVTRRARELETKYGRYEAIPD